MPDHSQGKGRESERFGAGAQIEPSAKALYYGFLDTRHQIARRYSVQYRKAVWQSQSKAPAEPSCG